MNGTSSRSDARSTSRSPGESAPASAAMPTSSATRWPPRSGCYPSRSRASTSWDCLNQCTGCSSGAMRDLETISTALTIAETGHLVLATLHTNDAAQAINRILDSYVGSEQQQIRIQLSSSLIAVIYQQLIPAVGGGRVAAFEVL